MSPPPMQPNGGGGSNCPYGTYSTYDDCLNNYWNTNYDPAEMCNCICLGSCEEDDDNSGSVVPGLKMDVNMLEDCLLEESTS
ncbi:MAG: hypothetical protein R6V04_05490, partial [bacterium]